MLKKQNQKQNNTKKIKKVWIAKPGTDGSWNEVDWVLAEIYLTDDASL